jgi:ubiquinone/menaquinone biosynthesis C-methylase UbiE
MKCPSRDELLAALRDNEKFTNDQWIASLERRKLDELEFHDQDRNHDVVGKLDSDTFEKLHGNKRFYSVVQTSRTYVSTWVNHHAPSRIVLDYACGDGGHAIEAAKAGAALSIGLDLSHVSIANAKRNASEACVAGNTFFIQGDCENTLLPDNCIDIVICSGMLHHLDLSYAFPELRRIMRPGGILLGIEALSYNPLIELYRRRTPQMRTKWEKEHILSLEDLRFAKRFFGVAHVKYWHLAVIPVAVMRRTRLYGPLLAFGNSLDRVLLEVPLVKLMAWQFTFELHRLP